MAFNFIQKIQFITKLTKAYKAIEALVKTKSEKIDDVKKAIELIKQGFETLVALCPEAKDFYVSLKKIIDDAFKGE